MKYLDMLLFIVLNENAYNVFSVVFRLGNL